MKWCCWVSARTRRRCPRRCAPCRLRLRLPCARRPRCMWRWRASWTTGRAGCARRWRGRWYRRNPGSACGFCPSCGWPTRWSPPGQGYLLLPIRCSTRWSRTPPASIPTQRCWSGWRAMRIRMSAVRLPSIRPCRSPCWSSWRAMKIHGSAVRLPRIRPRRSRCWSGWRAIRTLGSAARSPGIRPCRPPCWSGWRAMQIRRFAARSPRIQLRQSHCGNSCWSR